MSKKFITACLTALLVASVALPSIAAAVTVSSTEEPSTAETQTTASSELPSVASSIPEPETVASEPVEEVVEEVPTVEEEIVEEDYDQRELTEEEDETGHPFLTFEEKKVKKEFSIKGQLKAVINEENELTTKTGLSSFVLQRKTDDADWEDHKVFSIEEVDKIVSEKPYEFEYTETESEVGSYKYRLITDYSISTLQENQYVALKKHKSSYSVGEFKIEPVEPAELKRDLIPEMSPRMEIQPRAALSEKKYPANADINGSGDFMIFQENARGTVTVSSKNSTLGGMRPATEDGLFLVVSTQKDYLLNKARANGALSTPNTWTSIQADENSIVKQFSAVGTQKTSTTLTGLKSNTTYYAWYVVRFHDRYEWDKLYIVSNTIPGTGVVEGTVANYRIPDPTYTFKTAATDISYPANYKPTFGSFTFPNWNQVSMKLTGGTYLGDANPDHKGRVYLKRNGTGPATLVNANVNHSKNADGSGGTYSQTDVSNIGAGTFLFPGSRYSGYVELPNYNSNGTSNYVRSADSDVFSTPVYLAQDGIQINRTHSTIDIKAPYIASNGNDGAHPQKTNNRANDVEVRLSLNEDMSGSWTIPEAASGSNIQHFENYNVIPNDSDGKKYVTFKIVAARPKTTYWIQYKVKNAGGWSEQRKIQVTTKQTPLEISKPKFTGLAPTLWDHGRVRLEAGEYRNEISQNPNDGRLVLRRNGNENDEINITGNVVHGINSSNRTYNAFEINQNVIFPGSRYTGIVKIPDGDGTLTPSPESDMFYTPVFLSQGSNVSVSGITSTTADVRGAYVASNGSDGAHPNEGEGDLEVEMATDSQFINRWTIRAGDSNTNVQHFENYKVFPDSDGQGKRITFKIVGLLSGTQYYVRYRVRNAGGWSNKADTGFKTKQTPLEISKPKFTGLAPTEWNQGRVMLEAGTYENPISQDPNDGKLVLRKNGNENEQIDITGNVVHGTDNTTGPYNAFEINQTSIYPGSRYTGIVEIPDGAGDLTPSPVSDMFSTPVYLAWSGVTQENKTHESIEITAPYIASDGAYGAQPGSENSNLKIEAATNMGFNDSWMITAEGDQRFIDYDVIPNAGNKKSVKFKLIGLLPNTEYWIKYSVENAGGWSNEVTTQFKTNPSPLVLTKPTFSDMRVNSDLNINVKLDSALYSGGISTSEDGSVILRQKGTTIDEPFADGEVTHWTHQGSGYYAYQEVRLNELVPGTIYQGMVRMPTSYDTTPVDSEWSDEFVTPNLLDTSPTIETPIPADRFDASVKFTTAYKVGMAPVYLNQVKVEISESSSGPWNTVTTTSIGPKLSSAVEIDQTGSSPKTRFTIEGLQEGKSYWVKYSGLNASNVWSNEVTQQFTTRTRTPGLYFQKSPSAFDFGVIDVPEANTDYPLAAGSSAGDLDVEVENVGMTGNWKFFAKFDPLVQENGNGDTLTGAKLTLNKKLSRATATGNGWSNWSDATNLFVADPLSATSVEINSDQSSKLLWQAPSGQESGKYKYEIDPNSVKLSLLANSGEKGKQYKGKITWIMDITP